MSGFSSSPTRAGSPPLVLTEKRAVSSDRALTMMEMNSFSITRLSPVRTWTAWASPAGCGPASTVMSKVNNQATSDLRTNRTPPRFGGRRARPPLPAPHELRQRRWPGHAVDHRVGKADPPRFDVAALEGGELPAKHQSSHLQIHIGPARGIDDGVAQHLSAAVHGQLDDQRVQL